ncbi:MAG: hypothetical protein IPQ07_32425 [Myxococcales bacterium]|nr:hypothetical protein [Myxococcales bacterium]
MSRALAIVLVLGLGLAASGGCKQSKEPAEASEVLARSRALAAAMCACKDQACAGPLRTQWNELTKLLHGATFTEEQVEGLTTEDVRFERCMSALSH